MLEKIPVPVFWLSYFALMLLLLMLGETFIGIFVMVTIAVFMQLFLHTRSQRPSHPWYKLSVALASIFLVWLLITSIFSISWPLSLQAVFEWVFIINLFFWFLEAPWNDIDRRFWLLGVMMLGLVLVFLGIAALFFPQYSYLIPGMNLIYPTYGHNHLGVVLLMTIPMFWAAAKEWPSKVTQTIAILFNITPVFTFGRVIIGLTILQLFFVHQRLLQKSKIVWWVIRIGSGALIFSLIVQFLLGWYVDQGHTCPIPQYRNQVCKSWKEERRSWYSEQAVAGFKERVWTGSGPGTFGLVSEKHRQLPAFSTGFAHNDYLQFFVEYGIAGGLMFCAGFFWLLFKLKPTQVRGGHDVLYQGIYWGLVSVAINSFFDFDLNYIGVISMMFMGLGLLSKWEKVEPWPKKLAAFDFVVVWWHKWFHVAALTFLVGVALLFATTNILLDLGKSESVLRYFPYFHWQSKILYDKLPDTSLVLQDRFRGIYWHHSNLISSSTESVAMTSDEVRRFRHLFEIDPWSRMHKETYSYYMNRGDYRNAEIELSAANAFFMKQMQSGFGRENIPNEAKESLSRSMMWLADLQFQQGRFIEGAESMVSAQKYFEWAFNDSPFCSSLPLFYRQNIVVAVDVTNKIKDIPKQYFGKCRDDFADLYIKLYREALSTNQCDSVCEDFISEVIAYQPRKAVLFWEQLYPIHEQLISTALTDGKIDETIQNWHQLMSSIRVIEQHVPQNEDETSWGKREKEQLILLSNQILPKLASKGQDYQLVNSKILREDSKWLSQTLR